jgi:CheY-like chemotaxis protein
MVSAEVVEVARGLRADAAGGPDVSTRPDTNRHAPPAGPYDARGYTATDTLGEYVPSQPRTPKVLIVDDEASFREALGEFLVEEGFEVVGMAADGGEGIAEAERLRPDVVLMDFRMPSMDGIAAAREIKDRDPKTQILMLTAYDDPALRTEATMEGVFCYLVKGCSPSLILEMVSKAAARGGAARR